LPQLPVLGSMVVVMGRNIATNIRLPEEDYRALKLRARSDSQSVATHLRKAVQLYVQGKAVDGSRKVTARKPLGDLVGLFSSGLTDGAEQHDSYVYGWPKRRRAVRKK